VVFDDDVIESIYESDPLTGERMFSYHSYTFFPSKYFVTSEQLIRNVVDQVMVELDKQVRQFKEEGKYIEAQRIEERTKYDMEMLLSTGYCSGIEIIHAISVGAGKDRDHIPCWTISDALI